MSLLAKRISPPNQEEPDQGPPEPETYPRMLQPEPLQPKPPALASSSSSPQFFRFLDLPVELRKIVYDYFAKPPKQDDPIVPERHKVSSKKWWAKMEARRATVKEERAISITRSSLLSVSRQLNTEWAPIYFRSTDIVVHGPKLEYWGPTPRRMNTEVRTGRELGFEKFFLNVASDKSLGNVRKLRFDASIHRPQDLVDARMGTTVNWPTLRQFARILHLHRGSLPLLQEVEIYALYQLQVGINKSAVWEGFYHPTQEQAWSVVNEGGKWGRNRSATGA